MTDKFGVPINVGDICVVKQFEQVGYILVTDIQNDPHITAQREGWSWVNWEAHEDFLTDEDGRLLLHTNNDPNIINISNPKSLREFKLKIMK